MENLILIWLGYIFPGLLLTTFMCSFSHLNCVCLFVCEWVIVCFFAFLLLHFVRVRFCSTWIHSTFISFGWLWGLKKIIQKRPIVNVFSFVYMCKSVKKYLFVFVFIIKVCWCLLFNAKYPCKIKRVWWYIRIEKKEIKEKN